MELKVKLLSENAIVPTRVNEGDAGLDLYSTEDVDILPLQRKLIKTDIAMEIPIGYYGRICDRSGNALKKGLHVMAGCIDSPYRGEIKVLLVNLNESIMGLGFPIQIKKGDKIAQIVIEKCYNFPITVVEELSETTRGENGFGSTGN